MSYTQYKDLTITHTYATHYHSEGGGWGKYTHTLSQIARWLHSRCKSVAL